VFSIIRHSLSAVAGILIANGVLNDAISEEIIGAVVSIVSIVWSIKEKSATSTMIEGTIRQVITAVGSFITFISPSTTSQVSGTIVMILPAILGIIKDIETPDSEITGTETK
jgi:hypothetical protein